MSLKIYIFDNFYERIIKEKVEWPTSFSVTDQSEFLDNIISHFAKRNDYEKCDKLNQMKADGEFR